MSCPNTYFFATDEQDYINYRKTEDRLPDSQTAADSTAKRKTYTMDYLTRMDRVEETSIYKTDWMRVPTNDSTYFYVGKYNTYVTDANKATIKLNGDGTAVSQFTNIGTLRIDALKNATWGAENDSFFIAPANALGRMVVDTTSTKENLGVAFEPWGYMLKVSTGTNVRMKQDPSNPNKWISEEMWTITDAWSAHSIKATLMTDSVFSETDPGCDIEGWSKFVVGTSVPVSDGTSVVDKSDYACITIVDERPNGHLEFVLVNKGKRIHYDNNRLLGVQIPDQYPLGDATTLRIEQHRLKAGYTFDGWTTNPDGTGTKYQAGDVVDLASLLPETKDSVLNLYAQAHYYGTLQVAISFIGEDGKRYFLTHPGSAMPRYARARHFEDWENTWQGMEDAANLDPNYVSTFEMRHPNNELKAWGAGIPEEEKYLDTTEMVLDPRRYTMRGYVDSLTFYENFQPSKDEYLGLYYTNPNVILANNTWAGLFKTTSTATVTGWPDYQTSSIDSVKLRSTHYVEEEDPENHPDSLTLKLRSNDAYVRYNAVADEFDGVATVDKATYFQISAVAPADAHYIIVPDTTEAWRDTITFGYHNNLQTREEVWSSLIGKQLMAVMMVGKDTVFFHPNRNKIINDPNKLYLSQNFRVTQIFYFIPDARVTTVDPTNRVTSEETDYYWHNDIVSGMSSPMNVTDGAGNYIDIVDTLRVRLSLKEGAPAYRFKDKWSGFSSISDGDLKIPLVRKTYHEVSFDSVFCSVSNDEVNVCFPAVLIKDGVGKNDTLLFVLNTMCKMGTRLQDVEGNQVTETSSSYSNVTRDIKGKSGNDSIIGMHLNDKALAEVRLMDEYGNTPSWCKIKSKGDNTLVLQCLENGVYAPRTAYLYFAYIVTTKGEMRFVSYRITVSQDSHFSNASLQQLVHSNGASGDEMVNGMQQVHENKRILYYYPEQDTELPIRERAFYGWWRWYRMGNDVNGVDVTDSDVPDSLWRKAPQNTGGTKYNYPFRTIIVDSVWVDERDHDKGKRIGRTQGRYTVFHYKSGKSYTKADPPSKNPRVAPPVTDFIADEESTYPTLTYVADISNYYDHLPMSLSDKNQVDTASLDTMSRITEPTLSLREIFELRPWTEMADRMEKYKTPTTVNEEYPLADESYMEDHVVMAPLHTRLLLQTEQRYNLDNVTGKGHSESLLSYYMHDDNWNNPAKAWDKIRRDSMIWCGGWDIDCKWYTYNPTTKKYTECNHTVTADDDFLQVPAKNNIDTVYYCLRARSWKTETAGTELEPDGDPEVGDYWFNICRYKICYHHPNIYGPKTETVSKKETRALITNDEIEQRYEVLERLNFDYIQPGSSYHIYPHPLPWADASYGYTYPETSSLPHNRYHNESDFPNHGEYGLINRIPYPAYWHKMEQHGGASNGYMIYCDGMSSAGQVAALSLQTNLCAGQKMFFSAYVGNPSTQTDKANPNFIFSVQGRVDNVSEWEDITTYMTGDIQPSDKWYQIYFPIVHNRGSGESRDEYTLFRVRIYNVSSNWDGNDFIIDDMCIFATKPPLIAYQANTACKEEDDDQETHVILRIDYQGITGESYNGHDVKYTVRQIDSNGDTTFVALKDHYLNESTYSGEDKKIPTVYGQLHIPLRDYEPQNDDSIFVNMNELMDRFEESYKAHTENPANAIFREGYIYEILEGEIRPVKYIVHSAIMNSEDTFTVHISLRADELLNSICGMTSHLKVSNRMVLELNGMEKPHTELVGLCANETYDISLRVKGSLYLDSVAPIDLNGSCVNDWLLYGDTVDESSKERYGYYYSDIKKVITEALRTEPSYGTNKNQFVSSLSAIDKKELNHYFKEIRGLRQPGLDPYKMISDLVRNGFLTLYKSKITVTVSTGDSVQYIIMPIVCTGSDALNEANIEVCPAPIFVKLKATRDGGVPLMVGGLHRDSTELLKPVEVLATEYMANNLFKLRVDSIMPEVGIQSIKLYTTNDPDFLEGIHTLGPQPDLVHRVVEAEDYYHKGDSIELSPSAETNFHMKQGYSYTFYIVMQDAMGRDTLEGGCAVGTIPFVLSVQPDYLRWDPQSTESNEWNNPDNWIGITQLNVPIHAEARFAPMAGTYVVIPQMTDGLPYPLLPQMPLASRDSVQKVNFEYNNCNIIRFLSGAALSQQQRMNYTDAIADMTMPQKKWAFRAAPVTGMLSGDIYMSEADLNWTTSPWEVGSFDASGRTYKTGNASFWLSVYSRTTYHEAQNDAEREKRIAAADWSKVTNGLSLSLPAASGFAVYARTASDKDAVVRLPKNDDIYYYYTTYGEPVYDRYEGGLRAERNDYAGGTAGKLAFHPDNTYQDYTISNDNSVSTEYFVFGNPTMGYIDIWGFIDDNCLVEEIGYMDESGEASIYTTVTRATAENLSLSPDVISNPRRYLPPMHAMMVKKSAAATSLSVTLNANRIVTDPDQKEPSFRLCEGGGDQDLAQAPQRGGTRIGQGIMKVTVTNPASPRCTSHLLLGQGYHADIRDGEDALLTTLNIDNFSTTNTPTTPFNIYALEGRNALSIDLRDSIVNVPVAFYMSDLDFEPMTYIWLTGVNNIDGSLVFYDALTNTERPIVDGICIAIETPTRNHERRYYICHPGCHQVEQPGETTGFFTSEADQDEQAIKIIRDDQVLIMRGGHVYTMMGQKLQ